MAMANFSNQQGDHRQPSGKPDGQAGRTDGGSRQQFPDVTEKLENKERQRQQEMQRQHEMKRQREMQRQQERERQQLQQKQEWGQR